MDPNNIIFVVIIIALGVAQLVVPSAFRSIHWGLKRIGGWKPDEEHPFHSLIFYRLGGLIVILFGLAMLPGAFEPKEPKVSPDFMKDLIPTSTFDPDDSMEDMLKKMHWISTSRPASQPAIEPESTDDAK